MGGSNQGHIGVRDVCSPCRCVVVTLVSSESNSRQLGRLSPLFLSPLFDEEMPDLMAASCLAQRTIENVRHGTHEPAEETWAALQVAMKLLDPSQEENLVGWRDLVTAEELASVLGCPLTDAAKRFQSRQTWSPCERSALLQYLAQRRARLALPSASLGPPRRG